MMHTFVKYQEGQLVDLDKAVMESVFQDRVSGNDEADAVEGIIPDVLVAPAVDIVGADEQARPHRGLELRDEEVVLLGAQGHGGGHEPDALRMVSHLLFSLHAFSCP